MSSNALDEAACTDTSTLLALFELFSVSYPFEYDLKDNKAVKGSNITLSIDLVGGTTFKILGMMLCNS